MKKSLSLIIGSLMLLFTLVFISCEPEDLGTATIYGIVTDNATGEPIQKAGVELSPSGLKTTTGTDGRFEFSNLMAGSYSLAITQKGYYDVNSVNVELSVGQYLQRDVQMELIPPALKVVDDENKDLSVLDFGSAEADIARAFNIFNDGTEKLEWEVTKTAFWIDSISKTSGALYSNNKQPIVVFIDRNKLEEGENKTTLQVTSSNGSKSITIKAENKREAIVINMLECSDITGTTAVFNAEMINDGNPKYTERGFVYSTNPMPTVDNTIFKFTAPVDENVKFLSQANKLETDVTYYVRAYAINALGLVYSANQVSFVVNTSYPTVKTNNIAAHNIFNGTAIFNGEIISEGDPVYTERGFVYGLVPNPTIDDTKKVVSGSGKGAFSANISGLEEGKVYYIRAFATNAKGTAYGADVKLDCTASKPILTTNEVTNIKISDGTATFVGNVEFFGDLPCIERGFVYATVNNPTIDDTKFVVSGNETGIFRKNVTNLEEGHTYYVRAYITNQKETVYGNVVTCNYVAIMPIVKTNEVLSKNLAEGTASFSGTIVSEGDLPYTERGFVYATVHNPTIEDAKVVASGSGLGEFTMQATELVEGKLYYIRAYIKNKKGIVYGEEVSLDFTATMPVVKTNDDVSKNIAEGTATFSGTIVSEGDLPYTERGFVYATTHNPTIDDIKVTALGTGLGDFTSQATGLIEGKTFYVRAFVTNSKGTVYGDEVSLDFTAIMPTIKTNGVVSKNIAKGTASFSGTIVTEGDLPYTERGFVYSTAHNPTKEDTKSLASGTGEGDFSSEVNDLAEGKIYYVRAFVTNIKGTVYGEEVSLDFTAIMPEVKTNAVVSKNIAEGTASLSGTIVTEGDLPYTERGFVYSTAHNPTINDSKVISIGSGVGDFISIATELQEGKVYYIRSFVTNFKETIYGEEISLDFTAKNPIVKTNLVLNKNIAEGTATFSGTIESEGDLPYTERGFVYSTAHNPSIYDTKVLAQGSGLGEFTVSVKNLLEGQTFYVRSFVSNKKGTFYGDEVILDFIAVMPMIKTNGVISKDIGGRTASFSGTIISIGDLPYIEYGFVYSVSHNPTISDKKVVASGSGLGDFTANASEIIEGSIYYVRAYLTNKKGTVYGEEVMMDFQPIKPIVVTLPITNKNISQGTVTLNGNISNIGDPAYIKKGFEFHSPLMVTILEVDDRNTGNFSYNLSNVSVGSSYYYRAFAKTKNETVYGEFVEFDFYAILPEVETVSIIAQSANSVYMVGNIKVGGNPMFHECGFIYGNISNPTIEDTSVTKIMVSNTISGQFEKQVSIALGTSTWYVRAYAKSSAGVSYGEIIKVSDPEYEDYVKLPKVSVEEKVLTSYINVVYRISHDMGVMAWESADTTCKNLVYNGFDDWELPSKSVLQQMYNEKSNINDLYDDYYWGIDSQLKPQGNGSYVPVKARYFSFKSGETGYSELNNQYRVRCVRKE